MKPYDPGGPEGEKLARESRPSTRSARYGFRKVAARQEVCSAEVDVCRPQYYGFRGSLSAGPLRGPDLLHLRMARLLVPAHLTNRLQVCPRWQRARVYPHR